MELNEKEIKSISDAVNLFIELTHTKDKDVDHILTDEQVTEEEVSGNQKDIEEPLDKQNDEDLAEVEEKEENEDLD